ncbi:MAG: hypothetical protein AB7F87_21420, partial [Oligoflexales bacterium]
LNNGTGNYAPLNNTDTVYNPITKRNELALFTVDWDNGFFGFVPTGANYRGGGAWSWTRPDSGGQPGPLSMVMGKIDGKLNKLLAFNFGAGFGLTGGQRSEQYPQSQQPSNPSPVSKCPLWEEQGGNAGKILQGIADVIKSLYRSDTGTVTPNKQLSHNATIEAFKKDGWLPFLNVNPEHWGGRDFEKHIDGAWFHLTVGYGTGQGVDNLPIRDDNNPPVFITVHCEERWRPSSKEHARDWWNNNVFRHIPRIPILPPLVFPRN